MLYSVKIKERERERRKKGIEGVNKKELIVKLIISIN